MVRRDCRGPRGSHGGRARRDAPAQTQRRRAARGQVNLPAVQPTQRSPLGTARHAGHLPRRTDARSQPLRTNLPRRRSHAERSRHARRLHGRAHRDRVRACPSRRLDDLLFIRPTSLASRDVLVLARVFEDKYDATAAARILSLIAIVDSVTENLSSVVGRLFLLLVKVYVASYQRLSLLWCNVPAPALKDVVFDSFKVLYSLYQVNSSGHVSPFRFPTLRERTPC